MTKAKFYAHSNRSIFISIKVSLTWKMRKFIVLSAVILHNLITDSNTEEDSSGFDKSPPEDNKYENEDTYEYLLSTGRNKTEINKIGKQKRDLWNSILT